MSNVPLLQLDHVIRGDGSPLSVVAEFYRLADSSTATLERFFQRTYDWVRIWCRRLRIQFEIEFICYDMIHGDHNVLRPLVKDEICFSLHSGKYLDDGALIAVQELGIRNLVSSTLKLLLILSLFSI